MLAPEALARFDAANQAAHAEIARRSGGRVETLGDLLAVIGVHPSWVIANVAFPRLDRAGPVDDAEDSCETSSIDSAPSGMVCIS